MKAVLLALLLAACAAPGNAPSAVYLGNEKRVERVEQWSSHAQVPREWTHLLDWQTGRFPVIVAFAAGSGCAFTLSTTAPSVEVGHLLRCRWRAAR